MKRSAWRYLWSAHDIRRKLLISLLILAIYRLVAHVPVPGANPDSIKALIGSGGAAGTLIGILDMLSGGTVSQFSVMAMGVYPYITAQIIIQLLVPIIPSWQKRMEEDPREGRKWMEKWTYYLAVPMAALQAVGQINIFNSFASQANLPPIISNFGISNFVPSFTIVASMTAGTMFGIWLGELISEYGMRNQGLSLIIFAGIVARIPTTIRQIYADEANRWFGLAFMLIFTTLVVFAIVVVQQGRRNIPVMYPGRRVGARMSMPVRGSLPLMVNMAGMIPIIFAQSILTFPSIIASFFTSVSNQGLANFAIKMQELFGGTGNFYWVMYFLSVVLFTFFYTDVLFAQQNYGENLKKVGAQIPGVARGAPTQRYLTRVLRRITFPGAFFLGLVAILPWLIGLIIPFGQSTGLMLVNSSGLLIVVGVVRDMFFNIDAELKMHGYDDTLLVR
ncbi:MAG: preprotein translocase subunit SecY [Chloroflexi bacterium RBG_19FT_COMBO_56_12]|nr:MAG: preprotein translocase subunit SecY [Chloroflexi bacterium RBG_19FT_COMBO_56_12]